MQWPTKMKSGVEYPRLHRRFQEKPGRSVSTSSSSRPLLDAASTRCQARYGVGAERPPHGKAKKQVKMILCLRSVPYSETFRAASNKSKPEENHVNQLRSTYHGEEGRKDEDAGEREENATQPRGKQRAASIGQQPQVRYADNQVGGACPDGVLATRAWGQWDSEPKEMHPPFPSSRGTPRPGLPNCIPYGQSVTSLLSNRVMDSATTLSAGKPFETRRRPRRQTTSHHARRNPSTLTEPLHDALNPCMVTCSVREEAYWDKQSLGRRGGGCSGRPRPSPPPPSPPRIRQAYFTNIRRQAYLDHEQGGEGKQPEGYSEPGGLPPRTLRMLKMHRAAYMSGRVDDLPSPLRPTALSFSTQRTKPITETRRRVVAVVVGFSWTVQVCVGGRGGGRLVGGSGGEGGEVSEEPRGCLPATTLRLLPAAAASLVLSVIITLLVISLSPVLPLKTTDTLDLLTLPRNALQGVRAWRSVEEREE
ncbi:hypothetical protein O3P69_008088 [Scylla paramamosain]|uniref:Uncharacterized protein n=1 Tax=Scylla paramamosain TaxID=85552 RepID=A0AAW0T226_SCYPA